MVQDDRARPVSGEIMSAAIFRGGTALPRDTKNACDAQFETLPQAKEAAPSGNDMAVVRVSDRVSGLNFLTQNKTTGRRFAQPRGFLFWSAGLCCVALAFWIAGGHALFMSADRLGLTRAGQALQISAVESRVEAINGRDILFIDGYARNYGPLTHALPTIEIAVTGNDGNVTRYYLGSRESQLESGSHHAFSSRLQAPEAGVKTVSVAFAEERH